jgi:putative ABC transport system substrate-binding protein
MKRREFIALLGGASAAWPLVARAQQSAMPVVGFVNAASAQGYARRLEAFLKGLSETGYVDGKNVHIEYRWADNYYDRLAAMAADLVRQKVTVIAALTTPAARAAKAATATIPIVFSTIADPVEIGFVASLSRPGGHMTGVTSLSVEIGPKLLELLREAVPSATTVALLINPANPNSAAQSKSLQAAAVKLDLQVQVLHASSERDFDAAFAKLRELRADALMISQDVLFNTQIEQLAVLTLRHAMPAIYVFREFAVAGGVMAYGASQFDTWRQAGIYVGRILKGEKPADLPVIQSSKFALTINLKTAKALGLKFPAGLLNAADEVIE